MTLRQYLGRLILPVLLITTFIQEASAKESFMDFVPQETPYLIYFEANQNIPDRLFELLKFTPLSNEEAFIKGSQPGFETFAALLYFDCLQAAKEKKFDSLGMPSRKEIKYGVYGLGLWPVVSIAVKDQKKFITWIAKRAANANLKLKQSGNRFQILFPKDKPIPVQVWLTTRGPDWMTLSIVPSKKAEQFLAYVSGVKKPKVALSGSQAFFNLIESVGVRPDRTIAFVSIKSFFETLLNRGVGLNQAFGWINDSIMRATPESCITEYLELANAIPYAIFGQKSGNDTLDVKALLKFSETVAQVTRNFNPPSSYELPHSDAVVHFNLGMNIGGIINGVQRFLQYRVQTPFTCPNLSKVFPAAKLQMFLSQLMMIPSFLHDIHGVSVALDKLEPVPSGAAIISAKNVMNLINIAKSMKPQFAQLELPAVDAGPQLLKPPPGKQPLPFKLNVEIKANAVGLSVSPSSTKLVSDLLKAEPSKSAALLSFSYNMNVLTNSLDQYINKTLEVQRKGKMSDHKIAVEQAKREGKERPPRPPVVPPNPVEKILDLYKSFGRIGMKVRFTEHGLEFNASLHIK